MPENASDNPPRLVRRRWSAAFTTALTAAACLAALFFRTPLRSRYWAWRLEHSTGPADRAAYLGALCNAGEQGRWGTSVLLAHRDAAVRQYGVLVLQQVRTPWARARLLERLGDPDPNVQRLAALGLAIHGDPAVIPTLKRLYQVGDVCSATMACLALERLGTRAAIAALHELALQPADAIRRAALVDALAGINAPDCVPALLCLLTDERVCGVPPRSDELARRALDALQAQGYPLAASSRPSSAEAAPTIAERAAAALARITSVRAPFSSAASQEQRAVAQQQWADWYAQQPTGR